AIVRVAARLKTVRGTPIGDGGPFVHGHEVPARAFARARGDGFVVVDADPRHGAGDRAAEAADIAGLVRGQKDLRFFDAADNERARGAGAQFRGKAEVFVREARQHVHVV